MQCASSITNSAGLAARSSSRIASLPSCSGARNRKSSSPSSNASRRADTQRGVEGHRMAQFQLLDRLQLIPLQGDQRRDHHRRAVEQLGGNLADRALSGAGRQYRQRVLAGQQRLDRFLLAGVQAAEVEALARHPPHLLPIHRHRPLPMSTRSHHSIAPSQHTGMRRTVRPLSGQFRRRISWMCRTGLARVSGRVRGVASGQCFPIAAPPAES